MLDKLKRATSVFIPRRATNELSSCSHTTTAITTCKSNWHAADMADTSKWKPIKTQYWNNFLQLSQCNGFQNWHPSVSNFPMVQQMGFGSFCDPGDQSYDWSLVISTRRKSQHFSTLYQWVCHSLSTWRSGLNSSVIPRSSIGCLKVSILSILMLHEKHAQTHALWDLRCQNLSVWARCQSEKYLDEGQKLQGHAWRNNWILEYYLKQCISRNRIFLAILPTRNH